MKSKPVFAFLIAAALSAAPATACAGEIFETNYNGADGLGTVGAYSTSGATINASLINGLSNPSALAVSGNDLFVLNSDTGVIGEYTTSGATVNASLITGLGLQSANGFVLSGGDFYVAETYGDVLEYNMAGNLINSFYAQASVVGIAVSGSDIFVTKGNQNLVSEYTASGAVVNATFAHAAQPFGILVSNGDVYFTDASGVSEYTLSGTLVSQSLFPAVAGGLGIAIYGNDLFYTNVGNIVSSPTGWVGEYTTSGQLVNSSLVSGLYFPIGIAVIPEPSTWVMCVIGGAAILAFNTRKRRP
jgi:hypothetical protein